jgi:predicted transcriptional regulator
VKVPAILQAAFVHALTVVKYSEARAAKSMGVSRSTVERYSSGQTEVNAKHVLQSKRLWRPFWLCVGRLMRLAVGGKT